MFRMNGQPAAKEKPVMGEEILFIRPVFKERIWGGERLKKDFGYNIPGNKTGECWAISAHPEGDCRITSAPFAERSLSDLWNARRDLFGNISGDRFPLLVKIIDARQDLSIQVHPDDMYACEHEKGSLGKTECWFVLDCDENATIVIGHHAADRSEMKQMIAQKRWKDFLREIPVHKGDFFQIPPGCLHAIKGGTLILETQQNSDVTYRVYDYDRMENGIPRPLHLTQSMEVITVPFQPDTAAPIPILSDRDCRITRLVVCPYYTADKITLRGRKVLRHRHSFTNISVIEGKGTVNDIKIKKGSHFILTSRCDSIVFDGDMSMIASFPQ